MDMTPHPKDSQLKVRALRALSCAGASGGEPPRAGVFAAPGGKEKPENSRVGTLFHLDLKGNQQ